MSATAFTIGLKGDLPAAVASYFTKFRVLPPRALVVSRTVTPHGPASFETLLKAIKTAQTPSFVIAVHGFEDGSGLRLPLANRGQAPHGAPTQHDKLQLLMTIAGRTPPQATAPERTALVLADAEIDRLLGLMRDVQAKQIQVIEFRGCNLGRNSHSVAQFRKFFGAASFGAPDLHSFFGRYSVGTGSTAMAGHVKKHKGTTFTYSQQFAGKWCHCCIGINLERKPYNGHVVADDDATVDAWLQANFDSNATRGGAKQLPIHGLWQFPHVDISSTDILADPNPRPIFPLQRDANKHQEYRAHVVYSP